MPPPHLPKVCWCCDYWRKKIGEALIAQEKEEEQSEPKASEYHSSQANGSDGEDPGDPFRVS